MPYSFHKKWWKSIFTLSHCSNKCILRNLILRQLKNFWCYLESPDFWIQKALITFWFNKVAFYEVMKELSAHFFRKFQNYFISLQWQGLKVTKLAGVCLGVNVYIIHTGCFCMSMTVDQNCYCKHFAVRKIRVIFEKEKKIKMFWPDFWWTKGKKLL